MDIDRRHTGNLFGYWLALAQEQNAVLISEDEWLGALYPKKITTLDDYVNYSSLLTAPD